MHRDDSTSLDDVASIEVDEVNALVAVHHQDEDTPFFVNQDQEYQMMVHLLHDDDDDNDERLMEMVDNSDAVHHFLF